MAAVLAYFFDFCGKIILKCSLLVLRSAPELRTDYLPPTRIHVVSTSIQKRKKLRIKDS